MTTTILVLSGGGPAPATPLPPADFVIAADSGFALAAALGVTVDLVVGDMDSITTSDLERAGDADVLLDVHPTDKDATDLELALVAATERGADRIVVAGGGAGRLDHLLGVALLLTDERWSGVELEWHAGREVARVVRDRAAVPVTAGELVSVVPITNAVVSIDGARWDLDHVALHRGTTRGISNEAVDDTVAIHVHSGVVLAVTTRGDE